MADAAVLIGGPRDGAEVALRDWSPLLAPTVYVAAPAVFSLARLDEPAPEVLGPVRGVYAAPRIYGGWSRDDAGRLRLTWRGWGSG